jgi:hypothetical protein
VKTQLGQSMIEALGFFMLLALLLGSLWQQLDGAARRAQARVEHSRSLLWQVASNDPNSRYTQNYAAARALAPVLQPLARWTALDLPISNLRVLKQSESTLAAARLHDDWSPPTSADLSGRPAQLVPLHHSNKAGLEQVLQVFSWLPVSREFAPSSLRLGWVNDEATPAELICEGNSC